MDSTKNIRNEPDEMKTLPRLKDLLTGFKIDIDKMNKFSIRYFVLI